MSTPGHIFKIENRPQSEKRVPVDPSILREKINSEALRLLQHNLHLESDERINPVVLSIDEVETYPELEKKYKRAFERVDEATGEPIERKPNSLFVVKYRSGHMINVVVDPETQSVIYIKAVSNPRQKSKSAGSHCKRVLEGDVMDYDGIDLSSPDSPVQLVEKTMEPGILDVAITTRKQMEASGTRARVGNVVLSKP
jgi:hypothetical protein